MGWTGIPLEKPGTAEKNRIIDDALRSPDYDIIDRSGWQNFNHQFVLIELKPGVKPDYPSRRAVIVVMAESRQGEFTFRMARSTSVLHGNARETTAIPSRDTESISCTPGAPLSACSTGMVISSSTSAAEASSSRTSTETRGSSREGSRSTGSRRHATTPRSATARAPMLVPMGRSTNTVIIVE